MALADCNDVMKFVFASVPLLKYVELVNATDMKIELSYVSTCLYYAPWHDLTLFPPLARPCSSMPFSHRLATAPDETRLSGDFAVNDPNLPGGKRLTTVYSLSLWYVRGKYCVYEA